MLWSFAWPLIGWVRLRRSKGPLQPLSWFGFPMGLAVCSGRIPHGSLSLGFHNLILPNPYNLFAYSCRTACLTGWQLITLVSYLFHQYSPTDAQDDLGGVHFTRVLYKHCNLGTLEGWASRQVTINRPREVLLTTFVYVVSLFTQSPAYFFYKSSSFNNGL
jgi:hypothetical protein